MRETERVDTGTPRKRYDIVGRDDGAPEPRFPVRSLSDAELADELERAPTRDDNGEWLEALRAENRRRAGY